MAADRDAPVSYRRHLDAARSAQAAGRIDEALAEYAAAVCLRPERAAVHLAFGTALHESGRDEAARRVLARAEHLAPHDADVARALGEVTGPGPARRDHGVGEVLHGTDGSYRVQQVRRGGHGIVYIVEALPEGLVAEGTYAVKTFQDRHPGGRRAFEDEALTWVRFDPHPHVVTALAVERIAARPALLLEYVPGIDLATAIRQGPMDPERVLRLGIQLCSGLEHAAAGHGRLHGDVKPANCLLTADDVLKVTDFGLAQPAGPVRSSTLELAEFSAELQSVYRPVLGTPGYRAPEQADPTGRLDARTDVYGVGIVLYEMLTGDRPRDGTIAQRHIVANPPPGRPARELCELVTTCVEPRPDDRPSGPAALRKQLEHVYEIVTTTQAPAIRSADVDLPATRVRQGVCLARLGRIDEAVDTLSGLVAARPHDRAGLLHLGIALTAAGRTREAVNSLGALADLDRDWVPMLVAFGAALCAAGRADEALVRLRRAVDLQPRARAAQRGLGAALLAAGHPDQALAALDAALALDPRDEQAYVLRAEANAGCHRFAEALDDAQRALSVDPASLAAAGARGRALAALGRPADALAALGPLPAAVLDEGGLRVPLAQALRGLGRYTDALAELQRVPVDRLGEAGRAELLDLLRMLGRHEEADALLAAARVPPPAPATTAGPTSGAPTGSAVEVRPRSARLAAASARPELSGPQLSPAILLCWELADAECQAGGADEIEPAHFLMAVGKLCDLGAHIEDSGLDPTVQRSLAREMAEVRRLFERSGVDATRLRRALRSQIVRGAPRRSGRSHRSRASRRVFARAAATAAREGTAPRLWHLTRAALLEIVGGRPRDPHAALVVFAGRLEKAAAPGRAPAAAGSETPVLDAFGRDLTALARAGELGPVVGRDVDVRRLAVALATARKPNVMLVGEPGVGKTAVVEALALAVVGDDPPRALAGRRIVELPMAALVAGTTYRGDFEKRIGTAIAEATAANVVLFVDEAHTILGAGGGRGAIDAAQILKPALARGAIQVIGATTEQEYRAHVETDGALARRFQLVRVAEPSAAETAAILDGLRPRLQEHHRLTIGEDARDAAVRLSAAHLPDLRMPDKAIDLLDTACAQVSSVAASSADRRVTADDVAAALAARLDVPVERLLSGAGGHLAGLADVLGARVLGQPEAVAAVAATVRAARAGLGRGPCCAVVLAGPAGCGKTLLATALADALATDGARMVRVAMSDYSDPASLSGFLGTPPGFRDHDTDGVLVGPVRRHPHSVVLLDDVDRAHPTVVEALLPMLTDGVLTTRAGLQASFADAVVVFTAGTGPAGSALGFGAGGRPGAERARADAAVRAAVGSALVDEVSAVVHLQPLGATALAAIVDRRLEDLRGRVPDHDLAVSDAARVLLTRSATDGRSAAAVVDAMVTQQLAQGLLDGRFDRAREIVVDVVDGEPVVRSRDAM